MRSRICETGHVLLQLPTFRRCQLPFDEIGSQKTLGMQSLVHTFLIIFQKPPTPLCYSEARNHLILHRQRRTERPECVFKRMLLQKTLQKAKLVRLSDWSVRASSARSVWEQSSTGRVDHNDMLVFYSRIYQSSFHFMEHHIVHIF